MISKKYLLVLLVTGFLIGCQSDDDTVQGNHGLEQKEQQDERKKPHGERFLNR